MDSLIVVNVHSVKALYSNVSAALKFNIRAVNKGDENERGDAIL